MDKENLPQIIQLVKTLVGAEVIKETHISYALLTDKFVYKIKKAVDFGFLDYTQLKSRRSYSIIEKDLNERFSKGIYLGVLKLVKKNSLEYELVDIENSLPAVEYILKMKRIKDGDFLDNRIKNGTITPHDMVQIGKEAAGLLNKLEDAPSDDKFASSFDAVRFNAVENFNQSEKYAGAFIDKNLFDYIQNTTLRFLDNNISLFNSRAENHYIKNGHGDLRLEHIYFNADGSIGFIDCIEFNKRFRYVDIIAECAFLSMELDFAHMIDYSDSFTGGFLSVFDDKNALKLLNYYRSYFAYVRAKVTCFMLGDKDTSWEHFEEKQSEVKRLIDMSAFYAYNFESPSCLLFYGLMGTGKTKNANAFAERFPVYFVSSDEMRKKSAGIEPTEKQYEKWNEGIYSPEFSRSLYNNMGEIAVSKCKLGRSIIIDASFTTKEYNDIFIKHIDDKIKNIMFTASPETINLRLTERLNKQTVADGRPAIKEDQMKQAVMPKADIVIETEGSISDNCTEIFKQLIK